jgi:hypothetical protein
MSINKLSKDGLVLNSILITSTANELNKLSGITVSAEQLNRVGNILSNPITVDLDLGTNKIINIGDPSAPQEAATKNYVDTAVGGSSLPLTGGTMNGEIDMNSNKITGLATCTNDNDAVNKAYSDTKLPISGGTMTGDLDIGNNDITNLGNIQYSPTEYTISDGTPKKWYRIATSTDGILYGTIAIELAGSAKHAYCTFNFSRSHSDTEGYIQITHGEYEQSHGNTLTGIRINHDGVSTGDVAIDIEVDSPRLGNDLVLSVFYLQRINYTPVDTIIPDPTNHGIYNVFNLIGENIDTRWGIHIQHTDNTITIDNNGNIRGVSDPVAAQDVATKTYVDTTTTANPIYVVVAGDAMTGALAMGTNKITGLATPTIGTDASTKTYVDTTTTANPIYVKSTDSNTITPSTTSSLCNQLIDASTYIGSSGSTIASFHIKAPSYRKSGFINENSDNNKYWFMGSPYSPTTNCLYFQFNDGVSDSTRLKLCESEGIDVINQKITGLATPTNDNDAVNKAYSDTKLPISGGTMTGDLDLGDNDLLNIKTSISSHNGIIKQQFSGATTYNVFEIKNEHIVNNNDGDITFRALQIDIPDTSGISKISYTVKLNYTIHQLKNFSGTGVAVGQSGNLLFTILKRNNQIILVNDFIDNIETYIGDLGGSCGWELLYDPTITSAACSIQLKLITNGDQSGMYNVSRISGSIVVSSGPSISRDYSADLVFNAITDPTNSTILHAKILALTQPLEGGHLIKDSQSNQNAQEIYLYGTTSIAIADDAVCVVHGDLTVGTNTLFCDVSNKYVGIGTTTPNAPLQFANTGATKKIVLYDIVNSDYQFYGFGANNAKLLYYVPSSTEDHAFYAGISSTASNELMILDGGTGNLTIDGTYSPFTGVHQIKLENPEEEIEDGLIVESTGQVEHKSMVDIIMTLKLSTTNKSKKVIGVFQKNLTNKKKQGEIDTDSVVALGEGTMWITNYGGNIENGDYICSSNIGGYGMLQDDDILHNYTVAKCVENIDWDNIIDTITYNDIIYKKTIVGCVFHSG